MKLLSKPFIYLAIFVAGGIALFAVRNFENSGVDSLSPADLPVIESSNHVFEEEIGVDAPQVWNDENALYSYVKKFGPKETIQYLHALGYDKKFGDCHQNAHEAGRASYEIYGDKSFQLCSGECHSGCYHGATEAYFKDKGTANLADNLKLLCSSELNSFFSHQCIHGIGHGLMAWTNYEVFEALEACDLLPQRKDSCWTGVFMENIVGGLAKEDAEKSRDPDAAAHFTKYLSNDPLYPCNDQNLGDAYKPSCYFLQTSRMVQLFASDFSKIAGGCLKAPSAYQRSCFESMGRDAGGIYRGDPDGAIRACGASPYGEMRTGCLIGAAQDAFWDPTGQDAALAFCEKLTDAKEKSACYTTIFGRAREVLSSKTELESFCLKTEKAYQPVCTASLSS